MLSNLNHLPNFRVQIKAFEITSQQRLPTMYYSNARSVHDLKKGEAAARECPWNLGTDRKVGAERVGKSHDPLSWAITSITQFDHLH